MVAPRVAGRRWRLEPDPPGQAPRIQWHTARCAFKEGATRYNVRTLATFTAPANHVTGEALCAKVSVPRTRLRWLRCVSARRGLGRNPTESTTIHDAL